MCTTNKQELDGENMLLISGNQIRLQNTSYKKTKSKIKEIKNMNK